MTFAQTTTICANKNVLGALESSHEAHDNLAKSHTIDWFDLDGALVPSAIDSPPSGERSDLLLVLEHAREAGAGKTRRPGAHL